MSVPETPQRSRRFRCPCRAVDRRAVRFFFNGLPEEQRRAVQAHLQQCRRCRRKLDLFARVWARGGQPRQTGSG